jgi:hypothetical protein
MWTLERPTPVMLVSPLAPEECSLRIAAGINRPFMGMVFGPKPVTGYVKRSKLWLRKRIWYGNSFQTYLYATIEANPAGGSVLSGEFRVHPLMQMAMNLWFAGVFVLCAILLIQEGKGMFAGRVGSTVLGMPIFGWVLFRSGRYLARNEACFLTGFLLCTIDATPAIDGEVLQPAPSAR